MSRLHLPTSHLANGHTLNLTEQVRWPHLWPTPKSTRRGDCPSEETHNRNSRPLSEQIGRQENGGQLNPMWVELLMGWPLGWTSLLPMNKGEFYEWLKGFGGEGLSILRQGVFSSDDR